MHEYELENDIVELLSDKRGHLRQLHATGRNARCSNGIASGRRCNGIGGAHLRKNELGFRLLLLTIHECRIQKIIQIFKFGIWEFPIQIPIRTVVFSI